jgi:hypothetical protein
MAPEIQRYLVANLVKFWVTYSVSAPGLDPLVVEVMVLQGHDGLDSVPLGQSHNDTKASVFGGRCDVVMKKTQAVGGCQNGRVGRVRHGCEVGGGQAVQEVRVPTRIGEHTLMNPACMLPFASDKTHEPRLGARDEDENLAWGGSALAGRVQTAIFERA